MRRVFELRVGEHEAVLLPHRRAGLGGGFELALLDRFAPAVEGEGQADGAD